MADEKVSDSGECEEPYAKAVSEEDEEPRPVYCHGIPKGRGPGHRDAIVSSEDGEYSEDEHPQGHQVNWKKHGLLIREPETGWQDYNQQRCESATPRSESSPSKMPSCTSETTEVYSGNERSSIGNLEADEKRKEDDEERMNRIRSELAELRKMAQKLVRRKRACGIKDDITDALGVEELSPEQIERFVQHRSELVELKKAVDRQLEGRRKYPED